MSVITTPIKLAGLAIRGLDFLSPLVDLAVRLWVANVFWKSGMTKFTSWESTLQPASNRAAPRCWP